MQLSAWEKESFFAPQDIVIIGSGLVGLWCARELAIHRPGTKITILERGFIPAGASTRNAGFSCFGSPTELLNDVALLGADRMWEIVEMRYQGMQKITQVFNEDLIDYERSGGYEVYTNPRNETFSAQVEWLNQGLHRISGREQCFTWADSKLGEFGLHGFASMIENELEGFLHSGKLLQALVREVQNLGVQVFAGAAVSGWEQFNGKISVDCKGGWSFSTERLLVCTNAFTSLLCPGVRVLPGRGQVILTSPVPGLKLRGAFHFEDGFYYFRNLGERVLLGGARNKAFETEQTTSMDTSEAIQSALEDFVATHILPGGAFTIEQRWSGIMGFTDDKQPILQKVDDRVYIAVSCNGMGVALAPIIAEKVCEMMN
jgi:glycine/D-amino acid oxidase-like deaminating enzyme